VTIDAILAGIGAIVTAAMGVILVVRELRRRDRIASMRQIDDLSEGLTAARQNLTNYQEWAFKATQLVIECGKEPPVLPQFQRVPPTPEAPSWIKSLRDKRQVRRDRRRAARQS
jgi:hypothetical protein